MKLKYSLPAILVIGALLRFYGIADRPLWIDEEQSVLEANGIRYHPSFSTSQVFSSEDFKNEKNISNVAGAVVDRDSGNGILYALVLSAWTSLTGNSAFDVRLISLLFSVLTILIIFTLTKELTGSPQSGYWSALLFSFHHLSIIYAQEARAYAMATFFISLSVLWFFRICNAQQRPHWTVILTYGFSSAAALLSHYFTFYILIGEIIIAILFYRQVQIWRGLIMASVITGLMLLMWMMCGGVQGLEIMQLRNTRYQEQSALNPENIFYGATTARTILAGVFQMVTHLFGIGFQNVGLSILATIPFLILPLGLFLLNRKYLIGNLRIVKLLGIFIFSAPILAVLLALISGHTISFQVLYVSFSVPFCCVLLGILFDRSSRAVSTGGKISLMSYGLILVLSVAFNLASVRHGTGREGDIRDEAAVSEATYLPGDTLIFNSVEHAMMTNLYFRNREILQRVKTETLEIK